MKQPQADRHNLGKPKLSLALECSAGIEEAARVLEYGMAKYSRANWKKGLPVTEILDSLLRHVDCVLKGEDIDAESGQTHAGHIAVNALFLAEMMRRSECDDRSKGVTFTDHAPISIEDARQMKFNLGGQQL